ncbi:hypothetical protein DFH06DRAFT_679245 [Mycena polygramma]|nr:hypothetical protein DFH06DRAFT_679245 [Mycena polygramma]
MASTAQDYNWYQYPYGPVYGHPFVATCNHTGCIHSHACPMSQLSHSAGTFSTYPHDPSVPSVDGNTVASNHISDSVASQQSLPCLFYRQGRCSQGDKCRFSHADKRPCKFFPQGLCWNGDSCQFSHDSPSTPSAGGNAHRDDYERSSTAPAEPQLEAESGDHSLTVKEAEILPVSSNNAESPTQSDAVLSNPVTPLVEHSSSAEIPKEAAVFEPCSFRITGRCARGDSCVVRHDEPTEPMYSPIPSPSPLLPDLKGNDWLQFSQEVKAQVSNDISSILESGTTLRPCKYFAIGACRVGNTCPYVHDVRAQPPAVELVVSDLGTANTRAKGLCLYYSQGRCFKGTKCRFRHEPDVRSQPSELVPAVSERATSWLHDTDDWAAGAPSRLEGATEESVSKPQDNNSSWLLDTDAWSPDPQAASEWGADPQAASKWAVEAPSVPHDTSGHVNSFRGAKAAWLQEIDDKEWSVEEQTEERTRGSQNENGGESWIHQTDDNPDWNTGPQDATDKWLSDVTTQPSNRRESTPWDTSARSPSPSRDPGAEQSWNVPWPDAVPEAKPPPKAHCKYFGQGHCFRGEECNFLHVEPAQQWDLDPLPLNDEQQHSIEQTVALDPVSEPVSQPEPVSEPEPDFPPQSICHCLVRFGSAATPEEVVTSFDSLGLTLSNYPPGITHDDLLQLAEPYGAVKDTSFRLTADGVQAHIQFQEFTQAAEARAKLNGITLDQQIMYAKLDSVSLVSGNVHEPELRRQLKLVWDAPTVSGWAFYSSVGVAKDEARRLNGMTWGARKITAEYKTPTQKHSIPVLLSGLPPHAKRDELQNFCAGSSSVSLNTPNYQQSQNQAILAYLAQFGSVDFLEVLPTDPSHLEITGFVQFQSSEAASRAVLSLKDTRHDSLGKGRVVAKPVIYSKYDGSNCPFAMIRDDLERLSTDLATVSCYDQPPYVHIYGRQTKATAVALTRKSVQDLIFGFELASWDPYFDTSSSEEALKRINEDTSFHIRCDRRRRVLRIWGNRENAQKQVTRLLKNIQAKRHSLRVEDGLMPALIHSGLQSLRDEFGASKILLDIRSQTITVLGDFKTQVESRLNALAPRSRGAGSCCLCFSDALEPVEVPCTHVYCAACLELLLRPVPGLDYTPPTCVAEVEGAQCLAPIPLPLIVSRLADPDRTQLLESSLLSFVRSQPDFRFCPSGCAVIYRPGIEGTVFTCPDCHWDLCASCAVPVHTGMTCAEYGDWARESGCT